MPSKLGLAPLTCLISAQLLAACADDRDTVTLDSTTRPEQPAMEPEPETNPDPDPEAPADEASLFLIGTRVFGENTSTTSYFHVVPSLAEGTTIDTSRALEVAGSAKLYAVNGIGWFAVGNGEDPTITRYTLGESGQLEKGDSISLQSYGVTSLWDTLYVISPTKLYYPDRDGRRLIVINPTAMQIEGEIALPETERDGFLSLYSYAHLTRGSEILFSVAWVDWDETDSMLGETGLVAVDTESDTVTRFEVDTRCGGITQPVITASGDVYFASSGLAGAAHQLGRLPTPPCALRVKSNEASFDVGYLAALDQLTGSSIAGEPIPGTGNDIFLRVFDENTGTIEAGAATWELTGQSAWRWARWDVARDEITPIAELPPSTADVVWFSVEGKVYGTETRGDYEETTLIDLTAQGGPRRALTAPGFLHGVARVR